VADVATGVRLTPEHRFPIASVTKIVTATLVLQLVGERLPGLDDEVEEIADGISVRQLLNHTSGLPDHYDDLVATFEPYRKDRSFRPELRPRDVLARVASRPPLFPPGSGWRYSGSNYLVLGLLVERITGASLREELTRRIFEPLGLDSTDLPGWSANGYAGSGEAVPPDLARGYLPADNPLLPDSARVPST
jgi:D-alanyl-D-alanine carboxypeptidase